MVLQMLKWGLLAAVLAGGETAAARPISILSANESEVTAKAIAPEKSASSLDAGRTDGTEEGAPAFFSSVGRKRKHGGEKKGYGLSADSIALMEDEEFLSDPDSLQAPVDTARLRAQTDSVAAKAGAPKLPKPKFVPDPKRALWLSLVLPGAGQIYNRKYWKLPIIYGGFLGCAYALMWNQQMYRDYSQAYLDIMDDDPDTHSYLDMLPPRYDITGREEQFQNLFKRKKDYYRRYRDLSAFCFIGVYLISVIDAYVDAQLSVFDITPDLTMRVEPAVIDAPNSSGRRKGAAYGVGGSFSF